MRSGALLVLFLAAACRTTSLPDTTPDLMRAARVPGLAMAAVDGTNVTTRIHGLANATTAQPVTGDTVFEAASLSKPVFAWAVMKLVEESRLDLDRSLATYLSSPYLKDPRAETITARMVLTHRTGFPNWRRRNSDLDIRFDPGSRFSYSGEGFIYLQRAVEAITGEPIETFMRRTVFDPLAMTASSYAWQPAYEITKAWPHDEAGGRGSERRKPAEHEAAAATLHTTAGDLGRFLAALLADPRGMFVR